MDAPTIVRQTKDYLLVKIPLPKGENLMSSASKIINGKMTAAERKLWKIIKEAEEDIRRGRVITAPSIDKALKRYAKQQWD